MIDRKAFDEKHKDFPAFSLEAMLEVSRSEFPKKLESLQKHIKNLNYGEAMYFADYIDDSFAFIFCDYEFRETLQQAYKAAKSKNEQVLTSLYNTISSQGDSFHKELLNFKLSD